MVRRSWAAVAAVAALPALASAAPATEGAPDAALEAARARVVEDLAGLRFEKLGDPVLRWDWIAPVRAPRAAPHQMLVVLVSFADRGFDRFADLPEQGAKLAAFYQEQLFDPTYTRRDTLSHYYKTQSLDTYHLQGRVLAPVKLSKPKAAYGSPIRPAGGDWRNDADPEGLVEEALALAVREHPEVDWKAHDRWDPQDFDGDGVTDEPDGYLDHLILVYAGGGQASCQALYKLDERLNPNVGADTLATLTPEQKECADRLWPHRFVVQKREGQGPTIEGRTHARGGARLTPDLWATDYNMQPEYTEASTFIHEFGHSIGLPDVYARNTSNSVGPWEVMAETMDPSPQNLSAWSRIVLGWLRPKVIRPPAYGGRAVQSLYLRTLDDALEAPAVAREKQAQGLYRAALVVLPPKTREIVLADVPGGRTALYSGQGNELDRRAELKLDLRDAPPGKPLTLSFDAWWDIEAGWDFAYLEVSGDDGRTWARRLPTDRRFMPAKHGHDGPDSLPGFTGLSGDADGDGRNESQSRCDPKKPAAHGEDKAGAGADPCRVPSWVRPSVDLSDLAGRKARVRWRYKTDMAAVQRGLMIADVALGDRRFGPPDPAWVPGGFVPSAGRHTVVVPHYYVLEHRDPYAPDSYDAGLAQAAPRFYYDHTGRRMNALTVRPRPGVLAWYYDGAFAWSENDPADNGPGRGFLLAVDANPNEVRLPGLDAFFQGTEARFDTKYDTSGPAAQAALEQGLRETICFVRNRRYRPQDLEIARGCPADAAPMGTVRAPDGRAMLYSYELLDTLLPGEARARFQRAGELFDYRRQDEKVVYRLRDRTLRSLQTLDAPFSLTPFDDGAVTWTVQDGKLVRVGGVPHPAVAAFADAEPARWQNPGLPFGGVAVPDAGFGFELAAPKPDAPAGSRVKVWITWSR